MSELQCTEFITLANRLYDAVNRGAADEEIQDEARALVAAVPFVPVDEKQTNARRGSTNQTILSIRRIARMLIAAPSAAMSLRNPLERELTDLELLLPEPKCVAKTIPAALEEFLAANDLRKVHECRFKTLAAFNAFIKKHPKIRTYKPSQNRMRVHAGDLAAVLAAEARDEKRTRRLAAEMYDEIAAELQAPRPAPDLS